MVTKSIVKEEEDLSLIKAEIKNSLRSERRQIKYPRESVRKLINFASIVALKKNFRLHNLAGLTENLFALFLVKNQIETIRKIKKFSIYGFSANRVKN